MPEKPSPVSVSMQFNDDGMSFDIKRIASVGIENIMDLQSYGLSRRDGRVMHLIEFIGGGTCEMTYSEAGKLEVFSGHSISLSFKPGDHLVLKKCPDPAEGAAAPHRPGGR